MNIFRTKYRVEFKPSYYLVYSRKWYSPWWNYVSMLDSLEDAKDRIAIEKANPVWEE